MAKRQLQLIPTDFACTRHDSITRTRLGIYSKLKHTHTLTLKLTQIDTFIMYITHARTYTYIDTQCI